MSSQPTNPKDMDKRALEAYSDAIAHDEHGSSAFQLGDDISPMVYAMLKCLGEDPSREGLLKTPNRVDRSMKFLTKGYHENLDDIVNGALFETSNEDIVLVRNIEIFSLCEHHLLPFLGKAHIAYIPNGKVAGLSKLPRIADMFARRLQLQERLTDQIADALTEVLNPKGVAVVLECEHMCMMMRGVEKVESTTLTRAFRGIFKTNAELRSDLASMLSTAK